MNWAAFGPSMLFLSIGLAGVLAAHRLFKLENSTVFGSIFFAPIIVYFVFSGQLSEFKTLGVEAKFREVAQKRIEVKAGAVKDLVAGTKHGELQSFFAGGSEVAILSVDESVTYVENPLPQTFRIGEQILVNMLQGKFELLVVVNKKNVVIGSFPKHWFLDLPSVPDIHVARGNDHDFDQFDNKRMRRNLSRTMLWDILTRPVERTKEWGVSASIKDAASQIDALRELNRVRADALPVVGNDGVYKGIVRRLELENAVILEPLLSVTAK